MRRNDQLLFGIELLVVSVTVSSYLVPLHRCNSRYALVLSLSKVVVEVFPGTSCSLVVRAAAALAALGRSLYDSMRCCSICSIALNSRFIASRQCSSHRGHTDLSNSCLETSATDLDVFELRIAIRPPSSRSYDKPLQAPLHALLAQMRLRWRKLCVVKL